MKKLNQATKLVIEEFIIRDFFLKFFRTVEQSFFLRFFILEFSIASWLNFSAS
jgi:hypothetical protein